MNIFQILTFLSPLVLLLGACIGIRYYLSLDNVNKALFVYLMAMLLADIGSRIFGMLGNNLFVLLIYSLVELSLAIVFYYRYLYKATHRLILVLSVIALFYILWEIVMYRNVEAKQFQPYAKVVDNFIIILLALTYFHEKINVFKDDKWEYFRLNTAILIFFSVTMLFFLPINYLINETTGIKFFFWLANVLAVSLFYSYLTVLIWKNGRSNSLKASTGK